MHQWCCSHLPGCPASACSHLQHRCSGHPARKHPLPRPCQTHLPLHSCTCQSWRLRSSPLPCPLQVVQRIAERKAAGDEEVMDELLKTQGSHPLDSALQRHFRHNHAENSIVGANLIRWCGPACCWALCNHGCFSHQQSCFRDHVWCRAGPPVCTCAARVLLDGQQPASGSSACDLAPGAQRTLPNPLHASCTRAAPAHVPCIPAASTPAAHHVSTMSAPWQHQTLHQ